MTMHSGTLGCPSSWRRLPPCDFAKKRPPLNEKARAGSRAPRQVLEDFFHGWLNARGGIHHKVVMGFFAPTLSGDIAVIRGAGPVGTAGISFHLLAGVSINRHGPSDAGFQVYADKDLDHVFVLSQHEICRTADEHAPATLCDLSRIFCWTITSRRTTFVLRYRV